MTVLFWLGFAIVLSFALALFLCLIAFSSFNFIVFCFACLKISYRKRVTDKDERRTDGEVELKEEPPQSGSERATLITDGKAKRATLMNDGVAEWYQKDWPHEFYVKKSGSVDVKKGLLSERSEF